MNVQFKFTLLLLTLVGAFVAALGAIKTHEDRQFARLTEVRTRESELSFDKRVAEESKPLAVLVKDFSAWDDMVLAVAQRDDKWLGKNVGPVELARSDANALWVLDPTGRRMHAVSNLYSDKPLETPLPRRAFEKLGRERFGHFYVALPDEGWTEVRAATITGSEDAGAPRGAAGIPPRRPAGKPFPPTHWSERCAGCLTNRCPPI